MGTLKQGTRVEFDIQTIKEKGTIKGKGTIVGIHNTTRPSIEGYIVVVEYVVELDKNQTTYDYSHVVVSEEQITKVIELKNENSTIKELLEVIDELDKEHLEVTYVKLYGDGSGVVMDSNDKEYFEFETIDELFDGLDKL